MPKKKVEKKAQAAKPIDAQIFSEVLQPNLSKSDQRKKEIIEGAIQAYSEISYEHLSYDDIGGPAGTSRKLVQHYFPDKKQLFEISMTVIRAHYQALVIEEFTSVEDPRERFATYVRAAVGWPRNLPSHVRAWFLYYLVCSQDLKMRKLHQSLADTGAARIAALIGEFHPAKPAELTFLAKTVQRLITGGLIEFMSERVDGDLDRIQIEVARAALAVVDAV